MAMALVPSLTSVPCTSRVSPVFVKLDVVPGFFYFKRPCSKPAEFSLANAAAVTTNAACTAGGIQDGDLYDVGRGDAAAAGYEVTVDYSDGYEVAVDYSDGHEVEADIDSGPYAHVAEGVVFSAQGGRAVSNDANTSTGGSSA